MSSISGINAVESTRKLARSALPDAPVEPYEPPRPRRRLHLRARTGALLRATARRTLALANHLDPAPTPHPAD